MALNAKDICKALQGQFPYLHFSVLDTHLNVLIEERFGLLAQIPLEKQKNYIIINGSAMKNPSAEDITEALIKTVLYHEKLVGVHSMFMIKGLVDSFGSSSK